MSYVATINTPGYLPDNDDPAVFDTAEEAWDYLANERKRHEDDFPEWSDPDGVCADGYSDTVCQLAQTEPGTVYGNTPGYEGDHDLGLAYSVTECEPCANCGGDANDDNHDSQNCWAGHSIQLCDDDPNVINGTVDF